MIRKLTFALMTSSLALGAAGASAATKQPKAAPVADLIKAVNIPYEEFTLDNGLRVVVHEDRKAPIVGVSVWYGVGSKHEPQGKTGFAHLFEHLMFGGSENVPNFDEAVIAIGGANNNGSTWFDRTNYVENVPTAALDAMLFVESDRMGHLLGAVTQEKLDIQRGVVQNEKRQGDNQPYGIAEYEQLENLYPSGHPYHHSTIGSMGDLTSASLADVKKWFTDNYGPNNAILVLAGDIDANTAKPLVEKWFGSIARGPQVAKVDVPVPTLDKPLAKTIKDQISTTRIHRMWAIPGLDNPDSSALAIAGSVLGGLASSRLDNALVRDQQVAVSVTASAEIFAQGGQFVASADVKPGVDPKLVADKLDEQIALFLKSGPNQDELNRAATRSIAGQIAGLELVGGFSGKASTLAEGLLYSNNSAQYKVELERSAKLTPAQVTAVANKWLTRPVFSLTIEPGERTEGGENRAGFAKPDVGKLPAYYHNPNAQTPNMVPAFSDGDRSKIPAVGTLQALDFPTIERAKLKNGIEVYFAKRTAVPALQVSVSFDAGYAADPKSALGTQSMMLAVMDEGTTTLGSIALAETQERLGANISSSANSDNTVFSLFALKANLKPSLALLADFIRNPAFDAKELERVRAKQLNRISGELKNPSSIATRALLPALYGPAHPYGIPPSGTGDPELVKTVNRDALIAFHNMWLRPDMAKIFVVGDSSLKEVTAQLNKSFGTWKAPTSAKPLKNFDAVIPKQTQHILLIDRPNSPQSIIAAGQILPLKGSDDLELLRAGNEILGAGFLSRLNTNLRETKGWSYGVRSQLSNVKENISYTVFAPVQSDRTGDSISELLKDSTAFVSNKGVTPEEFDRTIQGNIRELPGSFETSGEVLNGIQNIVNFSRSDDYYEKLANTYNNMTAPAIDAAARAVLRPSEMLIVVVGDAKLVKPQLDKLGLPIEIQEQAANPVTK